MSDYLQLGYISTYLGTPIPLSKCKFSVGQVASPWVKNGFSHYLETNKSLLDMAISVASETLHKSEHKKLDIGQIVIASDSFSTLNELNEFKVKLMRTLNLPSQQFISVVTERCGNFGAACQLICDSLPLSQFNSSLLICVDKAKDTESRFMPDGVTVCSDGASACIISRSKLGSFQIMGIKRASDITLLSDSDGPSPNFRILNSLLQSCSSVYANTALKESFVYVGNNFSKNITNMYKSALGVSYVPDFQNNQENIGHVYSSDILISLKSLMGQIIKGNKVNKSIVALSNGPDSFTSILLKSL